MKDNEIVKSLENLIDELSCEESEYCETMISLAHNIIAYIELGCAVFDECDNSEDNYSYCNVSDLIDGVKSTIEELKCEGGAEEIIDILLDALTVIA